MSSPYWLGCAGAGRGRVERHGQEGENEPGHDSEHRLGQTERVPDPGATEARFPGLEATADDGLARPR